MADLTNPVFVVYVVWHPDFKEGAGIAEALREHFRRKLFVNVSGGPGLSVIYRSAATPGSAVPLQIDLNEAGTTAVVVLADLVLSADAAWTGYIQELVSRAEAVGLGSRVFPVPMEPEVVAALNLDEQALRWDSWPGSPNERRQRLMGALTYQFCRMLRHFL